MPAIEAASPLDTAAGPLDADHDVVRPSRLEEPGHTQA